MMMDTTKFNKKIENRIRFDNSDPEYELPIYEPMRLMSAAIEPIKNISKESCIVTIKTELKNYYGTKSILDEQLSKSFFIVRRNDPEIIKMFEEEIQNNIITMHDYDIIKGRSINKLILRPGEEVTPEIYLFERMIDKSFRIVIKFICDFEDKHTEVYEITVLIAYKPRF